MNGSLGKWEMLWEHNPIGECFHGFYKQLVECVLLINEPPQNTLPPLKISILFACIIIMSRACVCSVFFHWILNQSVCIFSLGYFLKQKDCILPNFCSVNHRRCQEHQWHTQLLYTMLYCSYHTLMSSAITYWADAQQYRIYLFNRCLN